MALFGFILSVHSCSKDDKTETPTLAVRVDGLYDFALGYDLSNFEYEKKTIVLSVTPTTSVQETIYLLIEKAPEGMAITFSAISGMPLFTSTMDVTIASNIKNGVYPIKLMAINAAGVSKTYTFTVTVNLPCAKLYEGAFTAQETIDGVAEPEYPTYLYSAGPNLEYLYDREKYYNMTVNCEGQTVSIAEQDYIYLNPSSGKISGTGTISGNTITINCTHIPLGGGASKSVKLVYKR